MSREGTDDAERLETPAVRRRRLATVLGEPLSPLPRDEQPDPGSDTEDAGGTDRDDWLRSQVPPHYGV